MARPPVQGRQEALGLRRRAVKEGKSLAADENLMTGLRAQTLAGRPVPEPRPIRIHPKQPQGDPPHRPAQARRVILPEREQAPLYGRTRVNNATSSPRAPGPRL
jgi:hypothetical protein